MSSEPDASQSLKKEDYPVDWATKFKGHRVSIIVPPFIRFLSGSISLKKAVIFLRAAEITSRVGHPIMTPAFNDLHDSKESKQVGIDFETYFGSLLVINLVSEVEHFLGSSVAAALTLFPEKMGSHTFKMSEIIAASSTDELIHQASKSVLNSLMYEKPMDYVKNLCNILSIDAKHLGDEWLSYAELKARRDIGVHNNWAVNEIYIRKLREAGIPSDLKIGQSAIPDFTYLERSIDTCRQLIDTMVGLLMDKWLVNQSDPNAPTSAQT